MASSLSIRSITRYAFGYLYVSVVVTLLMVVYSYWDVIKLRYTSGFFSSETLSVASQQLFADSFRSTVTQVTNDALPLVIILLLASLVAYTLYSSYKFTVYDLDVNHNYMNARKVSTMRIVMHYVALYTASFVLPLLFWCYYFVWIFPTLVKVPLGYIVGNSPIVFMSVTLGIVLVLIVITQVGIVLTRITAKLLRKI